VDPNVDFINYFHQHHWYVGLHFLLDNALSYAEMKKQWMILRDNFFTLDGNECNKIGISYSGFRNQPGQKCNEPQNTCLASQIKDYWDVSIFD